MEAESQIKKIKTVKIFKTNVRNNNEATKIVTALLKQFPLYKINFDLDDEDRILRVETDQSDIISDDTIKTMVTWGYSCMELK